MVSASESWFTISRIFSRVSFLAINFRNSFTTKKKKGSKNATSKDRQKECVKERVLATEAVIRWIQRGSGPSLLSFQRQLQRLGPKTVNSERMCVCVYKCVSIYWAVPSVHSKSETRVPPAGRNLFFLLLKWMGVGFGHTQYTQGDT